MAIRDRNSQRNVQNIQRLPDSEKFGLISLVTRAAVSIPANVAEGSSRGSDKNFKRFLEYALGATFELETHLLISYEIEYLHLEIINPLLDKITEEQKMLQGLIGKL